MFGRFYFIEREGQELVKVVVANLPRNSRIEQPHSAPRFLVELMPEVAEGGEGERKSKGAGQGDEGESLS